MQFPLFAPIIANMLSQRNGFLQYQPFLSKAQPLFSVAAYFQKLLDTKITGCNINSATQQLSNSATQQLSNSATQQLSNSATRLCPDKRAAFSFKQQHHYFFSSIFADGTSNASVFTFTHRRYFAVLGIFCALGIQKRLHYKHIINIVFYRRSRPAVWFDSG